MSGGRGGETTRLAFMSQEHVDEMNTLLQSAPEVRDAASTLGTDRTLVYELGNGPHAETVYWQVTMGPGGFRFGLGPPRTEADVVIRCDYAAMIQSVRAEREGQTTELEQEVIGDEALRQRMFDVLEVGRPIATLDTELPVV